MPSKIHQTIVDCCNYSNAKLVTHCCIDHERMLRNSYQDQESEIGNSDSKQDRKKQTVVTKKTAKKVEAAKLNVMTLRQQKRVGSKKSSSDYKEDSKEETVITNKTAKMRWQQKIKQ